MTIYKKEQALQMAANAGFSGQTQKIIVAIALAESSLNDAAININIDGSRDRGILQINDKWHSEVNNACAFNAQCSFNEGYRISNKGANFSPWATFTSGAYLRYLDNATTSPVITPNPFNLQPVGIVTQAYHTVSQSTTEVLNSVPGFKGIVEALDLVEQFQPLKLQSGQTSGVEGPTDYTIFGIDTGIPNINKIVDKVTLPSNSIQALLVFITTNTAAFVIRALLVFIGLVIIIALVQNILGKSTSQASQIVGPLLESML